MVRKGKRQVATRRLGARAAAASKSEMKILEVRSPAQIPALESLLSKGPMTLVLVFADWCPACHRFMKNLWKPMCKEQKETSMNRVAVREDLVGNTSLAGSQYKYLPSLLLVGNDKRPAVFESPEGKTNAMPTPQNLDELKRITNAEPATVSTASTAATDSTGVAPATEEQPMNLSPMEPNQSSDVIPSNSPVVNKGQRGGCGCMMQSGGGCSSCAGVPSQPLAQAGGALFSSLLQVARGSIPASVLAATATQVKRAAVRRSRRDKKTRRRQRKI